jgi:hypothetical protein
MKGQFLVPPLSLLLFLLSLPARAQDAPVETSLKAHGFTCATLDGQNGSICVNQRPTGAFSYSQPVAVLIPAGLTAPRETIYYFHGFRGVCEAANASPLAFATEFQFLRQMQAHGAAQSVLVMPMSAGHDTTFKQELLPRFSAFTSWVRSILPQGGGSGAVVAGHSGAGIVIAQALAANPSFTRSVSKVILLDATYGSYGAYFQRARSASPRIKIVADSIAGSATWSNAVALQRALGSGTAVARKAGTGRHCLVPTKDFGPLLGEP